MLIISALTVIVGYTDVHTPQSVYAQGSEKVVNKDSTESSSSDSSQTKNPPNLPITIITTLISVNVTISIGLAGALLRLHLRSTEILERDKKNEVSLKEIEVTKKFEKEIRQLKDQIYQLKMENGNHELIIAHQLENTCANLNNILEKIGEEQIKKRKDEHCQSKEALNKTLDEISQKIYSLQENSEDKQEAGKIQEQINQKINNLEQESKDLEDVLKFIPKIKIINDKIIFTIIKEKIIKDIYKKYWVSDEQQDYSEPLKILNIIKLGFEEFNRYDPIESEVSAKDLVNNAKKFFHSIK